MAPPRSQEVRLKALEGRRMTVLQRRVQKRRRRGRHRVTELLEERGYDVTAVPDGALDPSQADVVWIAGNANWFPRSMRALTSLPPDRRPALVVWHSEPLPYSKAAGLPRPRLNAREIAKIALRDTRATDPYTNAWRLRRLRKHGLPDLLVVTSEAQREFLAEAGIDCEVVPIGYNPGAGRDLGMVRDIDVLFLGALEVPRRKRALRALKREGIDVHEAGSWDDPGYWGENRVRLMNRAKIVLNLSRFPGQFSGVRLMLGMANRALVVSEPIYRPAPFVPGEHFVALDLDDMPSGLRHYLRHKDERDRLAERGHRFVTTQLQMSRSMERVLDALARRLADRDG